MTKRNMEIFVAVVECGKMSDAAKKLYITQSSVSQAVAEIEREYNVALFERLSRSLFLTDAGRELAVYARQILALQEEMGEMLSGARRRMRLRIGATVTVGTCVISPIISRLKARDPEIRAELFVANTQIIEEKLLGSELDIALVEGRVHHPDLRVQHAIADRLVVICPPDHPFNGRSAVNASELAGQPLILREEGSGTREQFEAEMKRRHTQTDVIWNCYNTEAILNGVAAGHGLSIISERLVREAVREGKMWACDIAEIDLRRNFDLVIHSDKYLTDPLRDFMDVCLHYERLAGENGDNC